MIRLRMQDPTSLDEFREHVRGLIAAKIKPRDVTWSSAGDADLFGEAPPPDVKVPKFTVPGAYVDLARSVLCHRDPERFALLYELLWRLLNEDRMLLAIFTDPLVYQLKQMEKAVRRDLHKMTAFVRFRSVEDAGRRTLRRLVRAATPDPEAGLGFLHQALRQHALDHTDAGRHARLGPPRTDASAPACRRAARRPKTRWKNGG